MANHSSNTPVYGYPFNDRKDQVVKTLTTRGFAAAEAIRDRVPFKTHGALKAEQVPGGMHLGNMAGRLAGDDLERFNMDHGRMTYVVYSYATPIAWHALDTGWYRVEQKFSVTTSKHQGKLYLIP